MPPLPVRVRRVFAVLAAALAFWALVTWITGGGVLLVGPLRVSSRSALRPGALAVVLSLLALWRTSADERRSAVGSARHALDRAAPWGAALVAVALALTSALFGEHAAAGADSSGYLHQAQLWADGRGTLDAPVVSESPWPLAGWEVAPLGFAPSVTPGVLGPTYAPGLPWLMALGGAVAGDPGRFVWTPLAVGLIAWLTFVFTRREGPPAVGLAAAMLVASSPPLLFAATQTMSDLLAAALWTAVIVALGRAWPWSTAVAGVCAGLALAVRPNLVLVAGFVWTAACLSGHAAWHARGRRGVVLAVPLAIAAAVVAWINLRLWGSPFASGYGATDDLFLAANVVPNLANLWRWTVETRAWWMVAAVPAVAVLAATAPRTRAWPALALVAGVIVSYLPYAVFAEWWYLRFYMPAWPVLAAAVALLAWRALARWSPDGAPIVVAVVSLAIAGSAVRTAATFGVFELWKGAQRYPAVATWVREEAPSNTVVWSVQHSGGLAAAGVTTVARWDYLAPDALDDRVASLAAQGRRAWVVLDDWEEADWRRRFRSQTRGRLDWAPIAEARVGPARVHVFDLTTPTRATAPALIRVVHGGPWPWARRPASGPSK